MSDLQSFRSEFVIVISILSYNVGRLVGICVECACFRKSLGVDISTLRWSMFERRRVLRNHEETKYLDINLEVLDNLEAAELNASETILAVAAGLYVGVLIGAAIAT